MCGLYGFALAPGATTTPQRQALLTALAVTMAARGGHSWGLTEAGGLRRTAKGLGACPEPDIIRAAAIKASAIIGHTRFATTGAVTERNAHPFVLDKVSLAHNGVIRNDRELRVKLQRSVEVDSEHLALHLEEGRSFSDLRGYGAISWWHADSPNELSVANVSDGSLCIAEGTWGSVYASTEEALTVALDAARLTPRMAIKRLSTSDAEGHRWYTATGEDARRGWFREITPDGKGRFALSDDDDFGPYRIGRTRYVKGSDGIWRQASTVPDTVTACSSKSTDAASDPRSRAYYIAQDDEGTVYDLCSTCAFSEKELLGRAMTRLPDWCVRVCDLCRLGIGDMGGYWIRWSTEAPPVPTRPETTEEGGGLWPL